MAENADEIQQIVNDLTEIYYPESMPYLKTLDLDEETISIFFGQEKKVLSDLDKDELVGLALFANIIENHQESILNNPESSVMRCFAEATGFAAELTWCMAENQEMIPDLYTDTVPNTDIVPKKYIIPTTNINSNAVAMPHQLYEDTCMAEDTKMNISYKANYYF